MKGGSTGIGYAQAKFPLLGPGLCLFVLADFYEDLVGTLGEFSVDNELIDAGSATMVFVTGEQKFTVYPKLPSIFGTARECCGNYCCM